MNQGSKHIYVCSVTVLSNQPPTNPAGMHRHGWSTPGPRALVRWRAEYESRQDRPLQLRWTTTTGTEETKQYLNRSLANRTRRRGKRSQRTPKVQMRVQVLYIDRPMDQRHMFRTSLRRKHNWLSQPYGGHEELAPNSLLRFADFFPLCNPAPIMNSHYVRVPSRWKQRRWTSVVNGRCPRTGVLSRPLTMSTARSTRLTDHTHNDSACPSVYHRDLPTTRSYNHGCAGTRRSLAVRTRKEVIQVYAQGCVCTTGSSRSQQARLPMPAPYIIVDEATTSRSTV